MYGNWTRYHDLLVVIACSEGGDTFSYKHRKHQSACNFCFSASTTQNFLLCWDTANKSYSLTFSSIFPGDPTSLPSFLDEVWARLHVFNCSSYRIQYPPMSDSPLKTFNSNVCLIWYSSDRWSDVDRQVIRTKSVHFNFKSLFDVPTYFDQAQNYIKLSRRVLKKVLSLQPKLVEYHGVWNLAVRTHLSTLLDKTKSIIFQLMQGDHMFWHVNASVWKFTSLPPERQTTRHGKPGPVVPTHSKPP